MGKGRGTGKHSKSVNEIDQEEEVAVEAVEQELVADSYVPEEAPAEEWLFSVEVQEVSSHQTGRPLGVLVDSGAEAHVCPR